MGNRIDVIIPAHRAHATLGRALESLAAQDVAGDLDVTVVDDACPEGDYEGVVAPFRPRLRVRLVRLPRTLVLDAGPAYASVADAEGGETNAKASSRAFWRPR